MNWKKFLLIGLVVSAFAFTAAPRAEARISVGIGFGFPVGYGYGYGYPGYGYGYGYPGYGYGYSGYDYYGPRRVVYVTPRYYWHHGRRVYHRHRHWR
jgi:hypothetical protein